MTVEPPFRQPSPDWDMVTLAWAGNYLDGSPISGTIKLSYNSTGPMLDDDPTLPVSIYPTTVNIPITTTTVLIDGVTRTVGYVSVSVPASNDPDIQGSGGSYSFTENFTGGRASVNFVADKDAPGPIWLNKIAGGESTPAEPVSVVYYSDFTGLANRVQTLEEAGGGGGAALTSYVSQIESLPDYPETFPVAVSGRNYALYYPSI